MLKLYTHLQCLRADRRGITALEYGVLATIVVGAVAVFGDQLGTLFETVFDRVNDAVPAAAPPAGGGAGT